MRPTTHIARPVTTRLADERVQRLTHRLEHQELHNRRKRATGLRNPTVLKILATARKTRSKSAPPANARSASTKNSAKSTQQPKKGLAHLRSMGKLNPRNAARCSAGQKYCSTENIVSCEATAMAVKCATARVEYSGWPLMRKLVQRPSQGALVHRMPR
jgi:hypothetical protein